MKAFIFSALLLLPFGLFAQSQIKGRVTSFDGRPLDAVVISITKDGKIVAQTLADNGSFQFNQLPASSYQLIATLMGYEQLIKTVVAPNDTLVLSMKDNIIKLKDVVVFSQTPSIQHLSDKTVFNVQNSILAAGGTALDALRKAPGVQATEEGQVTAHNKGATIYIDDKPVHLSGGSLAAYLASIPSNNLSKIEVIQNPSARYDAQGGAVINIVTKKSKADGFNGSLGGGYTRATKGSYNTSGTFNYRKNALNIYGGAGYSRRELERHIHSYTIYESPGNYSDWEADRAMQIVGKSVSFQLGADYNFSKNQVMGILVNGLYSRRTAESLISTSVTNQYKSLADSIINTQTSLRGPSSQYSFNVNYKIKLDTAGKSLNVDLDYVPYRNSGDQWINATTQYPFGNSTSNFNIYTPALQNIDILSGKTDYAYSLGKSWHLESGVKYTSIRSDNNFDFYDNHNASPVYDISRSSHFKYMENTIAAYTTLSRAFGNWNLEGGLRSEQTFTTGNSITLDSVSKKSYLKFFPSITLTYNLSEDQIFSLNFNKRIDRPAYVQLNPGRSYSSPYSFQQGNPALQPFITTNASLSFTYKKNYVLTGSYSSVEGLISNVTVQDNVNKTIYDTQQNLDQIRDYTLNVAGTFNPSTWWEGSFELEGQYRKQKSQYPDGFYASHNWAGSFTTTQSFTVSREAGIKAEARFFYRTPINQGLLYINRTNDLSAGISKSIFHKQGSLKLAFSDILYGNPYRISTNYLTQHNGSYQKNDTRNVAISFTYKFGQSISAARKRETASEEERKRSF
jgi:outer membrane receptor protein involved in Fe transport